MEKHAEKEYSQKEIAALAASVAGDEAAFDWLMQNDCKELGALSEVLRFGRREALEWLINFHFKKIVSFLCIMEFFPADEEQIEDAKNYLLNNKGKDWAATADAVNGNDSANDWLQTYFPHFAALADAIINNPKRSGSRHITPNFWTF